MFISEILWCWKAGIVTASTQVKQWVWLVYVAQRVFECRDYYFRHYSRTDCIS